MADLQKIPVVVGVTGHRTIRKEDRPAIEAAVRKELMNLQAQCPHSPLLLLDSLAEGADLLCADIAEELGISLVAVLPRELSDYEKDFSEDAKKDLYHQCERAQAVFVAPPTEKVPEAGLNRDDQFRQAGIYVASHCHMLLALWDGGDDTPGGCGTPEAVSFLLRGQYTPCFGLAPRSGDNGAVIHIFTPRGERLGEPAGTIHILGKQEAIQDILQKTDDFNQNVELLNARESTAEPAPSEGNDTVLQCLSSACRTAGTLSRLFAKRYRRVLSLLAAAGSLLTFAFLLYDEVQILGMILFCGVMLFCSACLLRYASHSDCHRRYIEYRVLAECLRVQKGLRTAGSRVQAAELLSFTQQEETAWVLCALCALNIGEPPKETQDIRTSWVEAQRDYHRSAAKKDGQKLSVSERTVRMALYLSIVLYLGAVILELLCGGLLFAPIVSLTDVEPIRVVLKVCLGTISAVTLFISGYYGKLSLSRRLSDHQKMERFYEKMSVKLQENGQTEDLLTILAREELIENGSWCSYQRDNVPDINF